jgi:hypothetical protein
MAIIAPIAVFGILDKLVDTTDASGTLQNITSSHAMLRIGVALLLVVAVLDVVTGWALFIFFRSINNSLSMLAAWFRLVYAAVLVAATFYLIQALNWVNLSAKFTSASDFTAYQTLISVQNFQESWHFGLAIFGVHLLGIGYLAFKAGYMKRILGVLLVLAGAGYLIDGFGKLLSTSYTIELSAFTFVGEVVLIVWLFTQGRKMTDE